MRAGLLNKVITIKSQIKTKDSYGSVIDTYTNYITTRARVIYNSGSKQNNNYEITPLYSVDFQIRFRNDITEAMRILYNDKLYKILAIQEIGIKDSLMLKCEQINE